MPMAEVRQLDPGITSFAGQLLMIPGQCRRIDGSTQRTGKYQALVLVGAAQFHLVEELAPTTGSLHIYGFRILCNAAPAGC